MLVAGRIPNLHTCGEDMNMQGILKSGHGRTIKPEPEVWRTDNQRGDDARRLVRFCEDTENSEKDYRNERSPTMEDTQDIIKFGGSTYIINNSDPNSAVRKLFPNSKLTPINPFVNKSNLKERNSNQLLSNTKYFQNSHNLLSKIHLRGGKEGETGKIATMRKDERKNMLRASQNTKSKALKGTDSATPLIERIKQLTCDNENTVNGTKIETEILNSKLNNVKGKPMILTNYVKAQEPKSYIENKQNAAALPKPNRERVNFVRYNQDISHLSSNQSPEHKTVTVSPSKTDEARRTFLSSLAQQNEGVPGDRTSLATNSTTCDTVYSLSDIEEVLTDEEKEIKEAFSKENKQDELELFVQQGAGRTERLRKRYSTPKLENQPLVRISNTNAPVKVQKPTSPYFLNECAKMKKEKPKFGSTIEILQQLQQQIETPYQLEGRRTACSNYSDSSIPISDRLFGDESSDGYEPIIPKTIVHRTCSLDSKNYEEIDNYPSAFSVPRAKSQEHPRLTYIESDPYNYAPTSARYLGSFVPRNPSLEVGLYASSPNLNSHHQLMFPDRVASYNNLPGVGRQLHPVLQRQYCRYPSSEHSNPAEEGKVLTPPVRMHTYMNIPNNAPCYLSPPPYYKRPPVPAYDYDMAHSHSNIYQNVPTANPNLMALRRLCTERERGVPEGASSTTDLKEMMYPHHSKDVYHHSNTLTMPKHSSFSHQYCVDV